MLTLPWASSILGFYFPLKFQVNLQCCLHINLNSSKFLPTLFFQSFTLCSSWHSNTKFYLLTDSHQNGSSGTGDGGHWFTVFARDNLCLEYRVVSWIHVGKWALEQTNLNHSQTPALWLEEVLFSKEGPVRLPSNIWTGGHRANFSKTIGKEHWWYQEAEQGLHGNIGCSKLELIDEEAPMAVGQQEETEWWITSRQQWTHQGKLLIVAKQQRIFSPVEDQDHLAPVPGPLVVSEVLQLMGNNQNPLHTLVSESLKLGPGILTKQRSFNRRQKKIT